jgi:pimeloyl-ACP methyl ester carboxylesterase
VKRRWLLLIPAIPVVLVLLGAGYQAAATALDHGRYPAPGRLVDVGGYELHLNCQGEGSPTVVLDASHPATSSSWAWIQPRIAERTRVCAYDRAGAGWSDRGSAPRDMATMAGELGTLLDRSGERGPFVLVGHSWGGGVVRLLAERRTDVAGLVLIEPFHADGFVARGLPDSTLGGADPAQAASLPWLGRLGVTRFAPGLLGFPSDVPGLPERERAELRAYLASPAAAEAMLDVERALPATQAALRAAGPLGDLPLAVVIGDASDNATVGLPLQREYLALSSRAVERHVPGADHGSLVHDRDHAGRTAEVIIETAGL